MQARFAVAHTRTICYAKAKSCRKSGAPAPPACLCPPRRPACARPAAPSVRSGRGCLRGRAPPLRATPGIGAMMSTRCGSVAGPPGRSTSGPHPLPTQGDAHAFYIQRPLILRHPARRRARVRGGPPRGRGRRDPRARPCAQHGARQALLRAARPLAPDARCALVGLRPDRRRRRLPQLRLPRGHPLGARPVCRGARRRARARGHGRGELAHPHVRRHGACDGQGHHGGDALAAPDAGGAAQVDLPRAGLRPPLRHHRVLRFRARERAAHGVRPRHGPGRGACQGPARQGHVVRPQVL